MDPRGLIKHGQYALPRTAGTLTLGLSLVIGLGACSSAAKAKLSASPASSTSTSTAAAAPTVVVQHNARYGKVLTTAGGFALYVYTADLPGGRGCDSGCLKVWPPLLLAGGATAPVAGPGVTGLGTSARAGRLQVTYHGLPLYTYITDTRPGQITGQDVVDSAGKWLLATVPPANVIAAPVTPTITSPPATQPAATAPPVTQPLTATPPAGSPPAAPNPTTATPVTQPPPTAPPPPPTTAGTVAPTTNPPTTSPPPPPVF